MCWVENQCRTLRQQIPVFTAVSSRERHVCDSQQRRLWPLCVIINSFQQVLPFDSLSENTEVLFFFFFFFSFFFLFWFWCCCFCFCCYSLEILENRVNCILSKWRLRHALTLRDTIALYLYSYTYVVFFSLLLWLLLLLQVCESRVWYRAS